jgi:hypothetical protein
MDLNHARLPIPPQPRRDEDHIHFAAVRPKPACVKRQSRRRREDAQDRQIARRFGQSGTDQMFGREIDRATIARYDAAFGEQFTRDGIREQPDPISGGATGIGARAQGVRAPSGHEGSPANGFDFPAPTRERSAEAHREIARASEAIQRVVGFAEEGYTGHSLVTHFLNPEGVTDPQLRTAIDALHERMAIIPRERLDALSKDDTSTEADAVYFDIDNGAVYKRYSVEDGQVTQGLHPGELIEGRDGTRIISTSLPFVQNRLTSVPLGSSFASWPQLRIVMENLRPAIHLHERYTACW